MTNEELDQKIAEKVMGYVWKDKVLAPESFHEHVVMASKTAIGMFIVESHIPPYSTDISSAWLIVEKLCPKEDEFRLTRYKIQEWYCTFKYFEGLTATADTASLAICKAALLVVGEKVYE